MPPSEALDRERPLDRKPGSPAFDDQSSLDLAAQLQDQALTPAAEAIRGELQRRFQQALAQLDSDDREIILLRHFEQFSNSEAARILGLSEAAAGMRHLRALRRLRGPGRVSVAVLTLNQDDRPMNPRQHAESQTPADSPPLTDADALVLVQLLDELTACAAR